MPSAHGARCVGSRGSTSAGQWSRPAVAVTGLRLAAAARCVRSSPSTSHSGLRLLCPGCPGHRVHGLRLLCPESLVVHVAGDRRARGADGERRRRGGEARQALLELGAGAAEGEPAEAVQKSYSGIGALAPALVQQRAPCIRVGTAGAKVCIGSVRRQEAAYEALSLLHSPLLDRLVRETRGRCSIPQGLRRQVGRPHLQCPPQRVKLASALRLLDDVRTRTPGHRNATLSRRPDRRDWSNAADSATATARGGRGVQTRRRTSGSCGEGWKHHRAGASDVAEA
mmetsp:Transcript_89543/g.256468  ORF Transcript_89543/g.256468 Transcript_89543/m.256468 type:complete len:283 (+) Transcript_89543:1146-1994(+)